MSLKAFHRFFIFVAIFFCGWLTLSEYDFYTKTAERSSLYLAAAMGFLAVALSVYLVWFLRKSKKMD